MPSSLKHWSPALRRAMIKTRPEFFSWPVRKQECYCVAIPPQDRNRLNRALLEELFGRKLRSLKAVADAVKSIPLGEELDHWNEAILPLTGIGEDCFYLNECFAEGKTILNFPTVRAYDEDDYHFQERMRKKDDPYYRKKPYRGYLYLGWARLFVKNTFTYAHLSIAAGYIYSRLDTVASDFISELIPHEYVKGKHHGKREGDYWQWDRRVDAKGQEELLEELQHKTYEYLQKRYDALLTVWDRLNRCGVYLMDESQPPETATHFIFTDKQALAKVKFRSFLRDCMGIKRPQSELKKTLEEETNKLTSFIRSQHEALRHGFNPSVVRLRKRRKIMVHKNAFNSL